MSPKNLGSGRRAPGTEKWEPCWAVTFLRAAAMAIQIDPDALLTSLVCALQIIRGRSSRRKERNKKLPVLGLFLVLL